MNKNGQFLTHDEENGGQKRGLDLRIQVHGEVDAEVVRVGEHFLAEARPFLGDLAHLCLPVGSQDLRETGFFF